MASIAKAFFVDYTIGHAFDTSRMVEESEENKEKSLFDRLKTAIPVGIKTAVLSIVLSRLSMAAISRFSKPPQIPNLEYMTPTNCILIAPIVEEILFRGILQNSISYIQTISLKHAKEPIKNMKGFRWITSPAARVIATNSVFSLAHWANRQYLGTSRTVIQLLLINLFPSLSILHVTNGSILPSVACHATHNAVAYPFRNLESHFFKNS